jgi:tetratricopeptide (TPR) repeat protein/predicted Ser/Thr protein kinase
VTDTPAPAEPPAPPDEPPPPREPTPATDVAKGDTLAAAPSRAPWALADRLVLAAVEARVLGRVDHPVQIGRYRVERTIGQGGMGRILLAHDEKLQRKVAIKLVSPHLADVPAARARIVREARAMAKLSDPHVAQVYEVDEIDTRLYVAMEYVDGTNLRAWLDERPRSWREVVGVFLQAGRGLAAAHDKGLVHRDFKPENVVLQHSGRARVVDFGLAQIQASLHASRSREGSRDALAASYVDLTATGALMGTPAYMAPEQWSADVVDGRTDQWSFCAALYEALAGRRAYVGETIAEIRASLDAGVVAPLPATIPGYIGRAIRRGLQRDPASRWPDMHRLIAALDPNRRRRLVLGIVAGLATTGLIALALRPGADPCADAVAPMESLWSADTRASVDAAMREPALPWAPLTADAVLARLDTHAAAWSQAARAVCTAEQAPGPARACLDESRRRLDATIAELSSRDPAVLVTAAGDAELLPDPRACLEAPAIAAFSSDRTGAQREAEAMARRELFRASRSLGALSIAGAAEGFVHEIEIGRMAADAALAAAQTADHTPLASRAAWIDGRLRLRDGDKVHAEASFRRAIELAHETGDAPLLAAATIDLVYVVGNDGERYAEAADLIAQAEAMLAALGGPPLLEARFSSHRASVLARSTEGDTDEAIAFHEAAIERLRATLGPEHPDVILALGNLGAALRYADRSSDAARVLGEAIEAATALWGTEHPRTASLVGTLGLVKMGTGDLEGAEADLRRSLQVRERTLGADHDQTASARYNLALVLRRLHRHAEAVEELRRGIATRTARVGEDDAGLVAWLSLLGACELDLDRRAEARTALEHAQRLLETEGAAPTELARVRFSLAKAHAVDDPATARVLARMARAAFTAATHDKQRADIDAFLQSLGGP